MFTRRQTLGLFGAAAAATILPQVRSAKAAATTLRIGWQKFGVLPLAKASGALEKRLEAKGVSVEWNEFTSGPPLLEAVGAGALDFGVSGDVPPLFAQAAGGDLLYVGAYRGPAAFHGLLVQKDSPIQKLEDLKGKKIAYKRGSSAHNFALKVLAKAGLSLADITEVDLPPPDAGAAFKTGSIDAWAIWDPFFAVAEADPQTRVLTTSEGLLDNWGYFLGNGTFTGANPEVIVDVIDELAKVGAAAQANLDDTVKALAQITGVPADITRVTLTRSQADLGKISLVPDAALTYQQALADDFYKLKIVPKQLKVSDIVWHPKAS
ncbi:aliphatic sulfonate ABC transporter substrate-binding protein [Rhizobium sp. 1399]|jgi:sulfonate transport system substrate-binding protein|uniref:aliphatic sulfonate ABC transporter substrate-binding protein n=1 Tax=Rhizobium sp. 1399 TaxID=2817758 RepID=UPI000DDFA7C9|nr:aliphatic sulfonate ABC transporter substrate-binding protein [Rhizobium sp. 1399]MDR6669651.1 sulfonate transport system substrate-binding protein [Rhizobium sp. 1399]